MIKREQMAQEEATRDPIFLFQTKKGRSKHWNTERVFYSRKEAEAWGRSQEHNYGKRNVGWFVYCVCCEGLLASLLKSCDFQMTEAEEDAHPLTTEEAIGMLPDKAYIHTFSNVSGVALVGANHSRKSLIEKIECNGAEMSGIAATSTGHGLAIRHEGGFLFVETKQKGN